MGSASLGLSDTWESREREATSGKYWNHGGPESLCVCTFERGCLWGWQCPCWGPAVGPGPACPLGWLLSPPTGLGRGMCSLIARARGTCVRLTKKVEVTALTTATWGVGAEVIVTAGACVALTAGRALFSALYLCEPLSSGPQASESAASG